jgi:hypothetical protein
MVLEVSLCILMEGTHSDPCQLGFLIPNNLNHTEGILVMFCRKPKVPGASTQRLRWVDGTEACVTTWANAERWRWHAYHQLKVAAPMRHMAAPQWHAKEGALI